MTPETAHPAMIIAVALLAMASLPAGALMAAHCWNQRARPRARPRLDLPVREMLWILVVLGIAMMFGTVVIPVLLIAVMLLLCRCNKIDPLRLWGWNARKIPINLGSGVWLYLALFLPITAVMLLSVGIGTLLGFEQVVQPAVDIILGADDPRQLAAILFLAIVVAPLWEEIFFRGCLYPWLAARIGMPWGVLFSAVIFSAMHLHIYSFLPLAFLGAALALWYERTGRLGDCIALHAVFNAVTCGMLLLYKFLTT